MSLTTGPGAEARPSPAPGRRPASRLNLLGQFVLIPLAVVAMAVSVFVLFGLVAGEPASPEQALGEIRSGSATRRWQAAWELSRILRQSQGQVDPALVPRLVETFEWARQEDPRVRRYLALALAYLRDPRAVPALVAALEDPDPETRLWSVEALGAIGDPAAAPPLARLLDDPDPGLRKQAVHALGSLGSAAHAAAIRPLLTDEVADVRWNAALTLAAAADPSGLEILLDMLDRERLRSVPGIRPDQEEAAMVASLVALGRLGAAEARPRIEHLSREDSSLKVRQAALDALTALDGAQADPGA